jgi:hypothetical protein
MSTESHASCICSSVLCAYGTAREREERNSSLGSNTSPLFRNPPPLIRRHTRAPDLGVDSGRGTRRRPTRHRASESLNCGCRASTFVLSALSRLYLNKCNTLADVIATFPFEDCELTIDNVNYKIRYDSDPAASNPPPQCPSTMCILV